MIKIDSRTGSVDLLPYLSGVAELATLDFGDASFPGKGKDGIPVLVGVERKKVEDMIESTISGRFQGRQLPGLVASYNVVYLIVEGIADRTGEILEVHRRGWNETEFTVAQFDNMLNTLMMIAGVKVISTRNDRETALTIRNLYNWWQKGWEDHRSHLGFYVEPPPSVSLVKPSLIRRIAKELPGVGWQKSLEIEKYFASTADMWVAEISTWQKIPGIGKTLAGRIYKALRGEE